MSDGAIVLEAVARAMAVAQLGKRRWMELVLGRRRAGAMHEPGDSLESR
jgi:hypothetical protein